MKKFFVILLAVCMLAMAGCNTTGNVETSGDKAEKIQLKIAFWEGGTEREIETALEELVKKYKVDHENVSLDIMSQPYNDYQNWLRTRLAANEAPDITLGTSGGLKEQFKQGYILELTDYYNSPNPYADGRLWADIFADGKISAANESEASLFAIPITGLGFAYYYNKDIYKQLGLSEPETYREFIENCKVIDGEGINPIAVMGAKDDQLSWINWYMMTGLYGKYYVENKDINPLENATLGGKEAARAVDLGYFDMTKGVDREALDKYFDMLEEYAKYSKGAMGLDEVGAKTQFLAGKAAHILSGSWDISAFLMNDSRSFEVGAFPLPVFTEEDSPYTGLNLMGSSVQPFGITTAVNKSEAYEKAAVDFMMFITAPENYKTYIENTFAIPVVKDVDVDPIFTAFTAGNSDPIHLFSLRSPKSIQSYVEINSFIFNGESYDRDEAAKAMQSAAVDYANSIMERDGLTKENNYLLEKRN